MTISRWKASGLVLFATLIFVFVMSSPTLAYILPARHYFKQYLKSRASINQLKIRQTTTVWKNGHKTVFEERVFIRVPGKIRVEKWRGNKRVQVDVWNQSAHLHWKKGQPVQKKKRRVHRLYDLFGVEKTGSGFGRISNVLRYMRIHYRGRKKWSRSSDYLEQLNVRLTWFRQAPTVVFGKNPRAGRLTSQIWLDKKRYFPVRYLGGLGPKGATLDIRFLEYHLKAGSAIFPGRIMIYRKGKLAQQILVYKVQTTGLVSSSLFSQVP